MGEGAAEAMKITTKGLRALDVIYDTCPSRQAAPTAGAEWASSSAASRKSRKRRV
jgi:hypothetical protein